jgi:hypothetical protein
MSTPMTTMPSGLDNELEPGRPGSLVKMPPKQALDQYINLKIAQYNDSSDDDEACGPDIQRTLTPGMNNSFKL